MMWKILAFLLVLGLLIGIIWTGVARIGKVKTSLLVLPPSADVYVDTKLTGSRKLYLEPGLHTFRAESPGFETAIVKVDLTETKTVRLVLTPLTEQAQAIADRFESEYLEAEKLAGAETQSEGEDFATANPITSHLPFDSLYFDINYSLSSDDGDQIVVEITAKTAIGRGFALQQIRDWGLDPTDYDIEFIDFANPFLNGEPQ